MTTLLLFILFIAAFFLTFLNYRKTGVSILGVALVVFFAVGIGLIPNLLLNDLQMPFVNLPLPQWKKQNAIILLGAGTVKLPDHSVYPTMIAYSRINEAARLFLDCAKTHNKCTIVVSGGDAAKTGKAEAFIYQERLIKLGIDTTHIKLEPQSLNTYKNAEFTSAILQKDSYDQVILVTSGIHLKRALLYFSHFGVKAKPAMADYLASPFILIPIGYNFALTDFAIHEYIGIVRFHLYNFLHWNKEVTVAGKP